MTGTTYAHYAISLASFIALRWLVAIVAWNTWTGIREELRAQGILHS